MAGRRRKAERNVSKILLNRRMGTFDTADRSVQLAQSSFGRPWPVPFSPGSLRAGSAPAQRPNTRTRLQRLSQFSCNLMGLHGTRRITTMCCLWLFVALIITVSCTNYFPFSLQFCEYNQDSSRWTCCYAFESIRTSDYKRLWTWRWAWSDDADDQRGDGSTSSSCACKPGKRGLSVLILRISCTQ